MLFCILIGLNSFLKFSILIGWKLGFSLSRKFSILIRRNFWIFKFNFDLFPTVLITGNSRHQIAGTGNDVGRHWPRFPGGLKGCFNYVATSGLQNELNQSQDSWVAWQFSTFSRGSIPNDSKGFQIIDSITWSHPESEIWHFLTFQG